MLSHSCVSFSPTQSAVFTPCCPTALPHSAPPMCFLLRCLTALSHSAPPDLQWTLPAVLSDSFASLQPHPLCTVHFLLCCPTACLTQSHPVCCGIPLGCHGLAMCSLACMLAQQELMCMYTQMHPWWGQWQDPCQHVKCIVHAGACYIHCYASWECACLLP